MLKIQIDNPHFEAKTGTSQKTGKPYSIREQKGWAFLLDQDGKPNQYPTQIVISLGDTQQPYPVGNYSLSDSSIYVDRFGRLTVGRLNLIRAAEAVQQSAQKVA
ncbi:G5P family DNA-binding protein [Leeia sp. TBRC 13508]|uniref:Single-stranded DNA-binding protein n=1 Tax=Leeia speluncae TaxID=2884804 RepID=A0ABS8DBV5_9NEIS|nr:G5P family DNA-binding protein [Leeia speluncae]MCB6185411.1 G5P family DNA-binding protein [Leeia speluncae]